MRYRIAILVLLVAAGAVSKSATAAELSLGYEAWKGGLYVMRIDAALDRGPAAYSIAVNAETEGLIGWLFPYRLETRTEGRAIDGDLTPQRFEVAARERDETKRRIIDYRGDGPPAVTRRPPEPSGPDSPDEALLRGSIDPASALLTLAERFARGGRCGGRVAVYDGRRRYDLALADHGAETLRRSRFNHYAGPARRCRATVVRLAGFRGGGSDFGRMPERLDVWLAPPLPEAPPLPVRLEGKSSFGSLVIHLVSAESRAQLSGKP
jgi:hypothetical protein